jgi:hypothetical protein
MRNPYFKAFIDIRGKIGNQATGIISSQKTGLGPLGTAIQAMQKTKLHYLDPLPMSGFNLLNPHAGTAGYTGKNRCISLDPAKHIDRTGSPDLIALAGRCSPKKDAEGVAGRPVTQISHIHNITRPISLIQMHWNPKIDFLAPGIGLGLKGQRIPDSVRG